LSPLVDADEFICSGMFSVSDYDFFLDQSVGNDYGHYPNAEAESQRRYRFFNWFHLENSQNFNGVFI
jgi:hypothetical protein